jgi:hypothetical protein
MSHPLCVDGAHFIENTAAKSPVDAVLDVSVDSTLHVGDPVYADALADPVQ